MTAADHANTMRDLEELRRQAEAAIRNPGIEPWRSHLALWINKRPRDLIRLIDAYEQHDALEAQAEAAERIDPVDGLTGDERAHRRDNALNYGEIKRLRKVLKAAQAASASWQLYKAQMEAEGAEYDTAPGSAPVLMDELAHALAALATDRTETQP